MFKINTTKRTGSAWNYRAQHSAQHNSSDVIQVYTENNESPDGSALVYADTSRSKLLQAIPALRKFIDDQTGDILLPGPQCAVDAEILWQVIHAALHKPDPNWGFSLEIVEDPVVYIKAHVILTLFEKDTMARRLQDRLWDIFQRTIPTIDMLMWIWDMFGDYTGSRNRSYNPPFANFYIQVIAWLIINLHEKGSLPQDVANYILEGSTTLQPGLKQAIQTREEKYGLRMGYEQPQSIAEQRPQNAFSSLKVSGELKDEAKPPEPIYYAKNYMEQGLWRGRDLHAQEDPVTHSNTPPTFSYSKAGTGISTSSFSKNANTPGTKDPDEESSSDDENARLAALASPLASKTAPNPFTRLQGAGGHSSNISRGFQASGQQTQRAPGQPQPRSQGQTPHVQPNPLCDGQR
jgi:hypothetical protein